jgi:hypothetical protein
MLIEPPPPDSPQPSSGLLARLYAAIGRRGRVGLSSVSRTAKDPTLPLLLLGAIGAAFFATVVMHAPAEIVFGLLFIGCLTAVLETKMHNDDRDQGQLGSRLLLPRTFFVRAPSECEFDRCDHEGRSLPDADHNDNADHRDVHAYAACFIGFGAIG